MIYKSLWWDNGTGCLECSKSWWMGLWATWSVEGCHFPRQMISQGHFQPKLFCGSMIMWFYDYYFFLLSKVLSLKQSLSSANLHPVGVLMLSSFQFRSEVHFWVQMSLSSPEPHYTPPSAISDTKTCILWRHLTAINCGSASIVLSSPLMWTWW